jgi:hypothetical protein
MAKYDISKTSKLKFARFGGLSSVNQRGYKCIPETFHSPPATRGFYCFVWPHYEMFLLGADWTKNPKVTGAKFMYVRDNKNNIVTDLHSEYESVYCDRNKYWSINTSEYNEFLVKNEDLDCDKFDAKWKLLNLPKFVLVTKPSPRIFTYDKELWHHLGEHLKQHQILATKGRWYKSTVQDYRTALEKEMHESRKFTMSHMFDKNNKNVMSQKSAFRFSGKDELECFIEKL